MAVTIKGSGQVPVQIVQGSTTTSTTTTSSTPTATNLTATITPTSSTSKILVLFNCVSYTTASSAQGIFYIYRNGSNVSGTVKFGNGYSGAGGLICMVGNQYLDSPATTSATTYTIYIASFSGTAITNDSSITNTITLLEISGS